MKEFHKNWKAWFNSEPRGFTGRASLQELDLTRARSTARFFGTRSNILRNQILCPTLTQPALPSLSPQHTTTYSAHT